MTQPNNLAALDKRVADAKQAEAGNGSQTQAGDAPGKQKQAQQNGPNQAQTGQDKPSDPKAQPDAGKAAPAAQR
jgi:hypothetical protein